MQVEHPYFGGVKADSPRGTVHCVSPLDLPVRMQRWIFHLLVTQETGE
jgi:hypothetical protein